MELPFALTEGRDGTLRYGIALWYRLMAAVVFGILSWTLVAQGQPPSVVGWLLLGLAALGVLYEERWTFGAGGASHAVGLVFAARRVELARGDLAALRIVPHVRGTIPGSAEEARENSRAMNGQTDAEPYARKPAFWKRPTLILVLSTRDGSEYAIDKVPARNRERIRETARRIGERTGLELIS